MTVLGTTPTAKIRSAWKLRTCFRKKLDELDCRVNTSERKF
jgi:hypothetical protein